MQCPVCQSALVVLELNEVEIDHCLHCRGIWLDTGELELLLEGNGPAAEFLKSFPVDGKDPEKECPICLRSMLKVAYGQKANQNLVIDKCAKNHGLWFDVGELEEMLQLNPADPSAKILKALQDIFGKTESIKKG